MLWGLFGVPGAGLWQKKCRSARILVWPAGGGGVGYERRLKVRGLQDDRASDIRLMI